MAELGEGSGPQNNENDVPANRNIYESEAMVVHHSDNPGASLVNSLLTEKNYMSWNRHMKIALSAKEKLGFIDGSLPEPDLWSPIYDRWKKIDSLVTSWILNSMSPALKEQFVYCSSAKKLWDQIVARYGMSNGPMVYKIGKEIAHLTQGTMSIVAYYNKLNKLWDEQNELEPPDNCTCVAACFCAHQEKSARKEQRHKLMQFLMGLSTKYDSLKDQITIMEPWPTVEKAYNMLVSVEKEP